MDDNWFLFTAPLAPAELCGYPGKTWLSRIWCAIAEVCLSLHCMLYIRLCMHKDAYASYVGGLGACHVSSCVQSLWYEYTWFTRAMSGYAQACRHVQHSLAHRTMNRSNCSEVKYSCAGWGSYLVTTTTSVYTCMHQFHNKSACGNVLDHQLASSNLIL